MGFRKLRWQGERWRDNMEGSLRPPEKNLYDIFIVFRNIQLYSNDKSKWLLLFLVKNWVSVIFGVMPFVSLQELGLRSPAGECLLSDQTPPQYLASGVITQPGLQEILLSQTKLRARRQFTTDFVGMERVTSKVILKSKSNCSIPQLLSTSA